jgi:hypothetical protein
MLCWPVFLSVFAVECCILACYLLCGCFSASSHAFLSLLLSLLLSLHANCLQCLVPIPGLCWLLDFIAIMLLKRSLLCLYKRLSISSIERKGRMHHAPCILCLPPPIRAFVATLIKKMHCIKTGRTQAHCENLKPVELAVNHVCTCGSAMVVT